jgi:hypothetical protein
VKTYLIEYIMLLLIIIMTTKCVFSEVRAEFIFGLYNRDIEVRSDVMVFIMETDCVLYSI